MTTPLRPMSTGEILDRTFNLYRNNFVLFAGIAVVPPALMLMVQLPLPEDRVALHVSPTPSLTVTVPVGLVVAGATGATLTLTVTAWPVTEGLGVWAMIAAVLLAFTAVVVWVAVAAT